MSKKNTNTLQEMRSKDIVSLDKDILTTSKKLTELKSELAVGKLSNHAAIAKTRKEIARMKTLRQEKIILKEIEG